MKKRCWQSFLIKGLVLLYLIPCATLLFPFLKEDISSLFSDFSNTSMRYFVAYRNTLFVAIGSMIIQWCVSISAGLALSKFLPEHISRKLRLLCVLLMLLPQQALILPQYLLLDQMGLLHNLCGVVVMSAFQPFLILLYWFGSEQIETSILEAAACEGATGKQSFFRIYLPLISPYILVGSLLSVAESWNLLEQSMTFLQGDAQVVLSTYFLQQPQSNFSVTVLQALCSALPLVLFFFFAKAKSHKSINLARKTFL